jgi:hypothetical protein
MTDQLFSHRTLSPTTLYYFLDGCRSNIEASCQRASTYADGYRQAVHDFLKVVPRPYDKTNPLYLEMVGLQHILCDDEQSSDMRMIAAGYVQAQEDIFELVNWQRGGWDLQRFDVVDLELNAYVATNRLTYDGNGSQGTYIDGIGQGVEQAAGYVLETTKSDGLPFVLDMVLRGFRTSERAWISTQSQGMQSGTGAFEAGFNHGLVRTLELLTGKTLKG